MDKQTRDELRKGMAPYYRRIWIPIVVLSVLLWIYSVYTYTWFGDHQHSKEAEAKANLAGISIALQEYARSHDGYFPLKISEINAWNPNALYTMKNYFANKEMREIAFKDSPFAGEYTYVPYVQDGKVCGLYLIAYGAEDFEGEDVDKDEIPDHVLQVLGSDGSTRPHLDVEIWPPRGKCPLPPLADLLKAQKENPQAQSVASPEEVR